MSQPWNRSHRHRGVRTAFVIAGSTVLATVFACSSSDSLVVFGGGTSDDAGTTAPGFIETDASDGGSSSNGDSGLIEAPQLCAATECPAPFATCDSFGAIPEYACSTNTSNDVDNCGSCGKKCLAGAPNLFFERACVNGTCQPFCQQGHSDCNGIPDDGCESDPLTDSNNCGICGNACPSGVACVEGKCGCPPGQTACDGVCVETAYDDNNCGACGTRCADNQPDAGPLPPHMFYGCDQGACTVPKCVHDDDHFYADCDGDKNVPTGNGCEVDLKEPDANNCGKCGNKCTDSQQCFETSDTGMDCQCKGAGKVVCPGQYSSPPSCASLDDDPMNCGSCGYVCPTIDGADIACVHGRCSYTCQPNQADCNGRSNDGCEVSLDKDPRNCGGCGIACDVANGQPCVGGRCVTRDCDAGPVK